MIKKKWKVFSLLSTIVIILSLIFFVNFELLLEDIMVLVAGEGTVYASKYDEDVFWQISNGMTKSEVLSLLGEPLFKSGDNQKYWNYSDQKKFNYRQRLIIFDKNNKVCAKEIGLYID